MLDARTMLPRAAAVDVEETWRLVSLAAAGDAAARETFCRRFAPKMRSWLRHRWRHTAFRSFVDDAVQDVLVECLRPRGALERCDRTRAAHGFEAFLHGVAGHVAGRLERRQARDHRHRRRFGLVVGRATPERQTAAAQLDRRWLVERIAGALAAFDRAGRAKAHPASELLQLQFVQGFTVREIAARWQQRAVQVHELRRRVLRRLRRCLLRTGAGSGDDAERSSSLLGV